MGWIEQRLRHRYADLAAVRLHYVEAGDGPVVVLLHGFPDFWYSWRHQISALVAAGFRVVAPDLRGYNLSGKPAGVGAYTADAVAGDVAELIRACGAAKAAVVGHDWGAGIAWVLAMRHPTLVSRLGILNVPHPTVIVRALRTTPRQLLRSWYMFFFQLPGLPEVMLRAGHYAFLRETLAKDPAFTPADIDRYVEAAAQPGALTGAINYYRAAFRHPFRQADLRRIEVPVQVIWGEQDPYLLPALADPPAQWVPGARVERIADAGHWVHIDQPDRVNRLLSAFLT